MAYKPFGEKLDLVKLQESITNRGYTGHEHIEDTDFIHSEMKKKRRDSPFCSFPSVLGGNTYEKYN
jgi:hypothetical protein